MRAYVKRSLEPIHCTELPPCPKTPGYTITQQIDEFYEQGVVPDFIPADLGEDRVDEVDNDGWFAVDPHGDIRTDPIAERERNLLDKIVDPDDPSTSTVTVDNSDTFGQSGEESSE